MFSRWLAKDWRWIAKAASGALAAGASTSVVISIDADADLLPVGNYNALVNFTNSTSGAQVTRAILLTINPIRMSVVQIPGTPGMFEIAVQGQSNSTYVIEASADLIQWTAIATNAADADGLFRYVDADANMMTHRFYRSKPEQ